MKRFDNRKFRLHEWINLVNETIVFLRDIVIIVTEDLLGP